jgi:hypothetical protein
MGNASVPGNVQPRTTSTTSAPLLSLDELLATSSQGIAGLSISTLKAILSANHVNARLILEKGELVAKVKELVEEERTRRERQRLMEIVEESEMAERHRASQSTTTFDHSEVDEGDNDSDGSWDEPRNSVSPPPRDSAPPVPAHKDKPKPHIPLHEREGLCVVCYDNDANIAIVDCGCVFSSSSYMNEY